MFGRGKKREVITLLGVPVADGVDAPRLGQKVTMRFLWEEKEAPGVTVWYEGDESYSGVAVARIVGPGQYNVEAWGDEIPSKFYRNERFITGKWVVDGFYIVSIGEERN